MKDDKCIYCGRTAHCADKNGDLICFSRAYDGNCKSQKSVINKNIPFENQIVKPNIKN